MSQSNWSSATGEYELFRFPKLQHDKSLQAWDSADELVVEHIANELPTASLAILDDMFGAISIGLKNQSPIVITDSYVSKQAIAQNCQHNNLSQPTIIDSLAPLPKADCYVLKLGKNLAYTQYHMQRLANLDHDFLIIATGKVNLINKNLITKFEHLFSNVHTSLAKKKSRLLFASKQGKLNTNLPAPKELKWPELKVSMFNHANVFSKDQIDIGGRFLAENLPLLKAGQKVVDLGCGNGLLSLAVCAQMKQSNTRCQLLLSDESFMAVNSAQYNIEHNFPENLVECHYVQDNCLNQQPDNSADVILCNPPFHQQNTITDHIAKQMFDDAHRVLMCDGELYVVANRHLPYQQHLKKLFGGFKVLAQNQKFIIYQCLKRK